MPVGEIVRRRECDDVSDAEDETARRHWKSQPSRAKGRRRPAQSVKIAPSDTRTDGAIHGSLICLGLNDSSMWRELHELMFTDFLKADMFRSASLGDCDEQVESFVDVAPCRSDICARDAPARSPWLLHGGFVAGRRGDDPQAPPITTVCRFEVGRLAAFGSKQTI
eukprot:1870574-Pleurochrysis_carterae.AAC.3